MNDSEEPHGHKADVKEGASSNSSVCMKSTTSATLARGHMDTISGQVIRVRSLSSRLAFADVKLNSSEDSEGTKLNRDTASGEQFANGRVVELVIKERTSIYEALSYKVEGRVDHDLEGLGVEHVPTALKKFSLGDIVCFSGKWETSLKKVVLKSFRCVSIKVLRSWSSISSAAFSPIFTPLYSAECTAVSESLCKFYTSSFSCPKGDRCQFKHVEDPVKRRKWVQERRAKKRERQKLKGDHLDPHSKLSKEARADVFAKFVVETFGGIEALSGGTGVLDIAGGRGDLYFELVHKQGVQKVTLVDPRREMRMSKKQRRWLKRHRTNESVKPKAANSVESSSRIEATAAGEVPTASRNEHHLRTYFDASFSNDHREILENCSVILGMHPDEATEWIVDFAIKYSKPFAVVPCCVFPRSGKYMSFDAWVEHLASKAPCIQRQFLNFQGKNLVLFATHKGLHKSHSTVDN